MLELSSDDKKENQFFDSGKLKREKTRRTTLYIRPSPAKAGHGAYTRPLAAMT
jgi:hypothetical protein